MSTKKRVFARAGLLGNPSDGFGGKTISFSIGQYFAEVEIKPGDGVKIEKAQEDGQPIRTVSQFVDTLSYNGYYGAERLIKASLKRFCDFFALSAAQGTFDKGLTIRWQSNIPRSVGLGGSSAIVVATLRALQDFFQLEIEPVLQPSVALSVEVEELGIPAGLQDRVIQCFQGMVFMDFSQMEVEKGYSVGIYQQLDSDKWFNDLYVAFGDETGQPTEVLHNDLKARFANEDPVIVSAMKRFAELAEQGREAIRQRDPLRMNELINANFDLRQSIANLHQLHVEMVSSARSVGASAKYCGSGGAIVGLCPEKDFDALCKAMDRCGCKVIRPQFVPATTNTKRCESS